MDLVFNLIITVFLFFFFVQCLKEFKTFYLKKRNFGKRVVRFLTAYNLMPLFLIFLLISIFIKREPPRFKYSFNYFEFVGNILGYSLFIVGFYISAQRREIWEEGIISPPHGAWMWDEIISYSLKKEGPFLYGQYYSWIKDKNILKFTVLKPNAEIIEINWIINDTDRDKIENMLKEKLSGKEVFQ